MNLNFSTWLTSLEQMYGDRQAVSGAGSLTFNELLNSSQRCAMILNSIGVKKGDKVALWAANSIEWVVSFFGIAMSGGVAVLMNYGLSSEEIAKHIKTVEADWAVLGTTRVSASDSSVAVKAAVKGGIPREHVINIDNLYKAASDMSQTIDYAAFYNLDSTIDPEDVRIILFNSNIVSKLTPVQLSTSSVLSNVYAASSLLEFDMTDSLCDALPLFDSFGLIMLLTWLQKGNEVYILSNIKVQNVMDMVIKNNITGIVSVSSIYSRLIRMPDFEEKLSRLLKICVAVDSFTTPTEMMRFENSLRYGKFLIGYGLPECSGIISMCTSVDPLEYRASSVGHILPGLNVKIWRDGAGFLNPGEVGEILVKGPSTMIGYLGGSEGRQVLDSDGWLHTGDLGMIDELGLLEMTGRIKDIIVRNGEKISPIEIENAIASSPLIREAKVFGVPHPIWGESIEACVVTEESFFDEKELRDYIWKFLPTSKIPSHFYSFPAFPLDIDGKLDQNNLKAELMDKLHESAISDALDVGIRIMKIEAVNKMFTIPSICETAQGIAEQLCFKKKQVNRIRLAVEEMLTERMANAYDKDGEISLEFLLMREWLRIRFVDSGKAYRLDDENASISAKIILANVDAYSSAINDNEKSGYNLDWEYPVLLNVQKFLRQQDVLLI